MFGLHSVDDFCIERVTKVPSSQRKASLLSWKQIFIDSWNTPRRITRRVVHLHLELLGIGVPQRQQFLTDFLEVLIAAHESNLIRCHPQM